ncbi:NAD-dependent epimerase/dehydratase family protein [Novipirellula rosea]|uniref:NAD-dependent epimerase/dehydratase domain-containing protein n=1 Tax=Novipirellula rosea TaxID=1031540 RepID=A0ABP8NLS8_9BACT
MEKTRPSVIVTGSSGLLGSEVCTALADNGYEVYGLDRVGLPEPPKSDPYVHDIECDFTDYSNVHFAIDDIRKRADAKVASIVHLAAYYDFSGEESPLYKKVTIEGTDRLLNALDDFEFDQFIFTSTMLIHEPCEHIREDDPLLAKWP